MSKKVRLEDIARECGVTKGLVSRALAGKYNVGDEKRNEIMQKAVELGYDFSKLRSKKKKRDSVVVIVSQHILLKEDFWQPMLKNLYATLNRLNIKMEYFVFDANNIDMKEVKELKNNPCMAFIVLHHNPDVIFKELKKFGKPIVEVDPKFMHYTGVTQVKYSNYTSLYEATQKLIDYGHKNLLFYGSDLHSFSFRERHEGYYACILKNKPLGVNGFNLNFDNTNLQYSDNEMLISFLNEHPEVTAILCANDIVALNVYKILNQLGKRVPNDISVVGFDNVSNGKYASPSLSTFNVPREQIGDEVGLYIIRLKQDNKPQYSEFSIRCDFIERDSVKKLN